MMEKKEIYSKYLDRNVTYTFIEDRDSDLFLYFFDGANLYDKKESFMGEIWELDKAVEKIGLRANLVGIYCAEGVERANEYSPFENFTNEEARENLTPKGILTGKFIIEELIPLVEKNKKASSRLIGGSSMGGIMSLYMGSQYPEIFDKVLAMSTHFILEPVGMGEILAKYDSENKQKIYLDTGTKEFDDEIIQKSYVSLSQMAYGFLKAKMDIKYVIDEGAIHNEKYWQKRLPDALRFLYKL
ncbi:alpha/beta hydrolase-fold protein [uncultured Anaerococcus sp.]|uniref:alpha/beta hydrolase n=1 Tax=uncultured Anaerococcus sp. TaxID=293428 RepID=UPI0028057077|nr:alpha/beta hydrolase-fold protein [uncultured Anaerococcus sp.]